VSVQSLSTALKISGVFSEDKSNTVVMRQSGHELAISANSGIGRGEVTVKGDLECPAQEVETAANAAYLLDALGACPMLEWNTGSVRVCLKSASDPEPIVLRAPSVVSKSGGDYSQLTAVVMPIRM
jgi:DNA polymerase III sliding clamp (beta) subunit (PCNA family)